MAETNIYGRGFDEVVGCNSHVAGVSRKKIRAMQQFQKYGRKKPETADVVKFPTYKPPRFAAE